VALFNIERKEVARRVVQKMGVGSIFGGRLVRVTNEIILIRSIKVESAHVYELYMSTMGECMGKIIRWPQSQTKQLRHILTPNSTRHQSCTQTTSPPSMSMANNEFQQDSTYNGLFVHTMDGLPSSPLKGPYTYKIRKQRAPRGPRKLGVARKDKLFFEAVEDAKDRRICSKRCLQSIRNFEIISLRYQAWGCKSYKDRTSWLVTTLRGFIVACPDTAQHCKFITRISGIQVCNACFAMTIGYSRRRLNKIISDIRESDLYNPIHGNIGSRRENTHISMARTKFELYIKSFGEPQPNREVRRKSDGANVQVICLPMSVRHYDIWMVINSSLKKMGKKEVGLSTFSKMWKSEFTNVHVPVESRFSKCQHCWEYKETRQSMPNTAMKAAVDLAYQLHLDLTIEEMKDYSCTREVAIESPDDTMRIIIDGMDQNITYVPKFRQSVKGIESRYVKTHLCGVLVHGVGLYCHVWIDVHHKHDSNQVVTSIMKVLQDVRIR
jgi:hypothetical protein